MRRLAFPVFAVIFWFALSGIGLGTPEGAGLTLQPPFTGVIENKTDYDISFPSGNSQGTLTVPAHSWLEYVSWDPSFSLIGYLDGKPYFCQKIQANPKSYQFMCKSYDFDAVILATEKPVHKPATHKKKRIKRKKIQGGVEALG